MATPAACECSAEEQTLDHVASIDLPMHFTPWSRCWDNRFTMKMKQLVLAHCRHSHLKTNLAVQFFYVLNKLIRIKLSVFFPTSFPPQFLHRATFLPGIKNSSLRQPTGSRLRITGLTACARHSTLDGVLLERSLSLNNEGFASANVRDHSAAMICFVQKCNWLCWNVGCHVFRKRQLKYNDSSLCLTQMAYWANIYVTILNSSAHLMTYFDLSKLNLA